MKQILVRTSWDCPYNDDFSCQQGFVSECCEKDGVFPTKCRLKDAPQEIVEAKPKQRTTRKLHLKKGYCMSRISFEFALLQCDHEISGAGGPSAYLQSCYKVIRAKAMEAVQSAHNKQSAPCPKCDGFIASINHNFCSNCGRVLPI